MINALRRLLNRFEIYRILRAGQWTARGAHRADVWKDVLEEAPVAGLPTTAAIIPSPNPLRTYFDGITRGKGIWKWTHYFDIYHRHFQKFIGREVNIVEIGVYSGGSLGMWKTYFGTGCQVYGIDINEACKAYESDKIKIFIGDQGDRGFWQNFRRAVPVIDILIDDGGHLPEQQIVTLEETLPYLRAGGVYVCEDIHGVHNRFSNYLAGFADRLNACALKGGPGSSATTSALQRAISSIHLYPFVAVIEKSCTPVEELASVKHGTEWQPFL
ncbi:MAG TPA: class I SAM-dependent methyltransferase [Candidatus Angelobacter sp.]|nr:class I SAM-dependent methyltransferase [Candidatus Angelobacter sp.]